MNDRQEARTVPQMPQGNWTVVLRLAGIGERLNNDAPLLLSGAIPDQLDSSTITKTTVMRDEIDGAVYAQFEASEHTGMEALVDSTMSAGRAADIVGLQNLDLQARIAPTNEISDQRPLPETFQYMDDMTPEAREIREAQQQAASTEGFPELEAWLK